MISKWMKSRAFNRCSMIAIFSLAFVTQAKVAQGANYMDVQQARQTALQQSEQATFLQGVISGTASVQSSSTFLLNAITVCYQNPNYNATMQAQVNAILDALDQGRATVATALANASSNIASGDNAMTSAAAEGELGNYDLAVTKYGQAASYYSQAESYLSGIQALQTTLYTIPTQIIAVCSPAASPTMTPTPTPTPTPSPSPSPTPTPTPDSSPSPSPSP